MDVTILDSRQARNHWRDLLDKVYTGVSDVIIERNGKPVAAMIPAEDYEALLDELDDLRAGRIAAQAYEEWKRDPSTATPWEQVRAELISEGLLDDN